MHLFDKWKGLSKKKKIQLGLFGLVALILIGFLIWRVVALWAAGLPITNQATMTYNDQTGAKTSTSNAVQTEVLPAATNAILSLSPASGNYYINQTFNVNILLDTVGNETLGTDAIITYNTADLEVQDAVSETAGVQIKAGALYSSYPQNSVSSGKISFSGIINPGSPGYNGTGTLAEITFKALRIAASSQVNFTFTLGATNDSNVTSMTAEDLLGSVNNGLYSLTPQDINLTFNYSLQGRPADTLAETGISLIVFPAGAVSPSFSSNSATGNDSGVGQITIPGLAPGNYDFRIKVNTYLARKLTNKTISSPMTLNFGTLLAGDLDNNNLVNSLDFSIMVGQWSTSNPISDINRDGVVNTIDFANLNSSWFVSGD